jgi:hypothetical protein
MPSAKDRELQIEIAMLQVDAQYYAAVVFSIFAGIISKTP